MCKVGCLHVETEENLGQSQEQEASPRVDIRSGTHRADVNLFEDGALTCGCLLGGFETRA
jgi:hypothetical protein